MSHFDVVSPYGTLLVLCTITSDIWHLTFHTGFFFIADPICRISPSLNEVAVFFQNFVSKYCIRIFHSNVVLDSNKSRGVVVQNNRCINTIYIKKSSGPLRKTILPTSNMLIVDFPMTSSFPKSKNQTPKKRRSIMTVRFSPTSTLHCFYKPQDEDISKSWYSSEDEQRFKQQAKEDTISCLRMKIRSDDTNTIHKTCPVGLELKLVSPDFRHKRLLSKELVRLAVRVEQERTIYDNDYDRQERIAAASMKHSEWSRAHAETIGTFQALAAQKDC